LVCEVETSKDQNENLSSTVKSMRAEPVATNRDRHTVNLKKLETNARLLRQ
jgi:hypothetical protein